MRRFNIGRSFRWRGAILGAAAVLSFWSGSYEGVIAAEDSAYMSEAILPVSADAGETEGVSPESAYISEADADAEEMAMEQADEQELLRESQAGEAVKSFADAVRAFSPQSREDAGKLLELENAYEALSEEEKEAVSSETMSMLREAEAKIGTYNRTDNDVSVSGNLPWYVQFSAKLLPDEGKVNDTTWIVVPYEMELRDLRTGEAYKLPEGESVTVTMPVPETFLRGNFVIYHYKSDGEVEMIVPDIQGDTMSFEATSFSRYSVAGSTVVAGIGITTDFNYPANTEESEESSDSTEDTEENSESDTETETTESTEESENAPGTEENGSTEPVSDTENTGNSGTTAGTENTGNNGTTPSTENTGNSGTTPSTENSNGTVPGTENIGTVSNSENSNGQSDNSTNPSSGTNSTEPQTNAGETPQNAPSVPVQVSPAQTGDGTEILYLFMTGLTSFMVLSGSIVMKKKYDQ